MTTHNQPWTPDQIRYEWEVIYDTRLGILGVTRTPLPEQNQMALEEADRAVGEILKGESVGQL